MRDTFAHTYPMMSSTAAAKAIPCSRPCFLMELWVSEIPDGWKEFAHLDAERLGNTDEVRRGKVALAALDAAVIGAINVRREREFLLSEPFCLSYVANTLPHSVNPLLLLLFRDDVLTSLFLITLHNSTLAARA